MQLDSCEVHSVHRQRVGLRWFLGFIECNRGGWDYVGLGLSPVQSRRVGLLFLSEMRNKWNVMDELTDSNELLLPGAVDSSRSITRHFSIQKFRSTIANK